MSLPSRSSLNFTKKLFKESTIHLMKLVTIKHLSINKLQYAHMHKLKLMANVL